jgi:hypothetical protein
MEAFELTNPVENSSICWRVDVCGAYDVHKRPVVLVKQRNKPASGERDCDLEFVAELSEVLPPAIQSKITETVVVLQQNVCAKTNFHLKYFQRLLQEHSSGCGLIKLALEKLQLLGQHDNARIWHAEALISFRSHTVECLDVLIDLQRGQEVAIERIGSFLQADLTLDRSRQSHR